VSILHPDLALVNFILCFVSVIFTIVYWVT